MKWGSGIFKNLLRSSHDDQKLLQELQNLKAELKLGVVQDPTQSALEEVATSSPQVSPRDDFLVPDLVSCNSVLVARSAIIKYHSLVV